MARQNEDFTILNEREVTGTGLASSAAGVAWALDIQRYAFNKNPDSAAAASDAAKAADDKAAGAQSAADSAASDAATAQARADAAYELADGKVAKSAGPAFAAMTGTATRTTMATYEAPTAATVYSAAQLQALMDSVQAAERRLKAVIDDLRANGALTP